MVGSRRKPPFRDLRHFRGDLADVVPVLLLQAENHVFRSREQIYQFEMLVHHADLMIKGILRGTDYNLFPVDQDLPFIRVIDPGDHIHQGRLAAAVLAENSQDFPPVYVQIHMIIGQDAAESLGDSPHLKCQLFSHGRSSLN